METNKINDLVAEALALSDKAKPKDKAQAETPAEVKATKGRTSKASA
jgi:hypothetical protein